MTIHHTRLKKLEVLWEQSKTEMLSDENIEVIKQLINEENDPKRFDGMTATQGRNIGLTDKLKETIDMVDKTVFQTGFADQVNGETEEEKDKPIEEQPKEPMEVPESTVKYDMERINAIYEMLPLIKECHRICMFMLENRGFNNAYKGYMDKDSEIRRTAELHVVFDFYGIAHSEWKNVLLLQSFEYSSRDHIDTICKYLALEGVGFDREDFTYKPKNNGTKQEEEVSRPSQGKNTGANGWRP